MNFLNEVKLARYEEIINQFIDYVSVGRSLNEVIEILKSNIEFNNEDFKEFGFDVVDE